MENTPVKVRQDWAEGGCSHAPHTLVLKGCDSCSPLRQETCPKATRAGSEEPERKPALVLPALQDEPHPCPTPAGPRGLYCGL